MQRVKFALIFSLYHTLQQITRLYKYVYYCAVNFNRERFIALAASEKYC